MRALARVALALATAAVATTIVVAVAVEAKGQPKEPVEQKVDSRYAVKVTPEMARHTRINDRLYFAGFGYGVAVLLILLLTPASQRIRDVAEKATRRPFGAAMVAIALFTLVTAILEFPLSYYAGFHVPHQFDLSTQSFASWLGDQAKGLGVSLVLGSVVGALALLGIRSVRRWWLALWLGSIPLILLMVVVQPIVLDPIFNKFEPLQNVELRQKLLALAGRAGIEHGRVYQVNKSKQTRTLNAYVNGIGPTARIVMWDTLLERLNEDEVLAVMGHEMGHYVKKDLWKGLAFSLALSFVALFLGQRIHDAGIRKWGAAWGIRGPGDPASIPWLLLIVAGMSFLLSPVVNGYSRRIEHNADVFSLELTHLNEPMAAAFVVFAESSKLDPHPSAFMKFWRYSHPPLDERIAFALHYQPRSAPSTPP